MMGFSEIRCRAGVCCRKLLILMGLGGWVWPGACSRGFVGLEDVESAAYEAFVEFRRGSEKSGKKHKKFEKLG